MRKKPAKKPKYKLGDIRIGHIVITIKKIYPPGHLYASKDQFGYLIDSTDGGEDNVLETNLGWTIEQFASQNPNSSMHSP
jgi:hypothetical protein